jgi:hypothetical protein
MFHNKIYIENLEIEDQIINQITGDLSFKLGGVEELKLSTNLIEPGITDSVSLGSVSKKFNNFHLNDIVLYNGANTTTISTESAGTTTLRLPVDNGADGQVLSTNGSGLLSWTDNLLYNIPQIITDADLQLSWENQTQITDSNPSQNDQFGFSVAISGDYAIVGAPEKTVNGFTSAGAAYIYFWDGANWEQQKILTIIDPVQGDEFGCSVAISGDYAIVGARWRTENTTSSTGAVYIYIRSETDWTKQSIITGSTVTQNEQFGWSVAISGDYIIVGVPKKDIFGFIDAGIVYMYIRDGLNWTEQQIIISINAAQYEQFGYSVAISGDYAIIGAVGTTVGNVAYTGSAYVYFWNGTDWTNEEQLIADVRGTSDLFGWSVAITSGYAIVGAPGKNTNTGAAYIYIMSGINNWTLQKTLTANTPAQNDKFGHSVSISGDYAIVGVIRENVNVVTDAGAAYIYFWNGTEWTEQKILTITTPVTNDQFGNSVAISGDYVIVGAIGKTVNSIIDAGAVYFNDGSTKYIAGESTTYITDTTQDFDFILPTIDNLEYHLLNNTVHTANLSGSIVTGNITSAVPGSIVDAYSYNGTWLVK